MSKSKQKLIRIIDQWKNGLYTSLDDFCDAYFEAYNDMPETEKASRNKYLELLWEAASRYSPFEEDIRKFPGTYYTGEDVEKLIDKVLEEESALLEKDVEHIKESIKGRYLKDIGHEGDLTWMAFDGLNNTGRGKECLLQVQCPWRLVKEDKIILGSADICNEKGDAAENNRLDMITRKIKKSFPLKVTDVEIDKYGDIKIYLEEHFILEIYETGSAETESWIYIDEDLGEIVWRSAI